MPKVSDHYGSRFLSAADLPDGTKVDTEIVGVGEVAPDESRPDRIKIALDLEGIPKPVLLNATNAAKLAEAWGDEADEWLGRVVKVRKGRVMFQGKMVPSIVLLADKDGEG